MIYASIFHSLVNQMFRSLVRQLVHHHLSIKCVDHLSVSLSIITCQSNVSITCQRKRSWTNEIGFFPSAFSMRLELKCDYVSHCDWIMNSGHFGIFEPQPFQKLECTPQILAAIFYCQWTALHGDEPTHRHQYCLDGRTQGLEVYGR